MKKTKALAKIDNVNKLVYYDNALYEHDHKENSKKDLKKIKKFNVIEKHNEGAIKILESGILYN